MIKEPFKNVWTPSMAREINTYWDTSVVERAIHIIETVGIMQSCHPGYSILEVGCGTGHIYQFLKQGSIGPYTGLDSSQCMLDIFKEKFPNVPLVCGDAQELPFDDKSYDIVVCIEVLRHMQYYDIAVKELVRVAKHTAIFTLEMTQGPDICLGEGRRGYYMPEEDLCTHYQVERNAQEVIDWVSSEFNCHIDIKLITARKWVFVVNKDRPGRSMSLVPLGGADSLLVGMSKCASEAIKMYSKTLPTGKRVRLGMEATIGSIQNSAIQFTTSLEVQDE